MPDNLRSVIYAFDRSFEGAVAACGMPLVGELPCHMPCKPHQTHMIETLHGDATSMCLTLVSLLLDAIKSLRQPTYNFWFTNRWFWEGCLTSLNVSDSHCPCAGIIAEKGFNFEGHLAESHADAAKASLNAKALANALLVCLVIPWTLCVVFYTGQPTLYSCA